MELIFQAMQIFCNYASSWSKTKKNIILFKVLSSIAAMLMLISVGQFIGALPVLFTAIRSTLFMFKERYKTNFVLFFCLGVYVLIAVFSVETFLDLIPTIISILASIIIWCFGPIGIKVGLSLTDSIWLIYYLYVGLYLSALNTFIQILIAIISIFFIKNKKNS